LNKIEKYAFQNLQSLVSIDLSHNYLDQLIDVFNENVNLITLDLSFNLIRQLENSHHFKLNNLILNFNGIKLLDLKSRFFSDLQSFTLNSNDLMLLQLVSSNLKQLALSYNRFKRVIHANLNQLTQLESIDLSNNLIEYVP
jgi:Leucine-rich repeat (LRR) protein